MPVVDRTSSRHYGGPSPSSPLRTTQTLVGSTSLPTTCHHHRQGSTKLSTRTLPPHSMAYQPNFSNGHRILCDYCARRRQTRHFHASADFQKQMDRHRIGRPVRRAQIKQWRHAPRGACRHRQSHSGRSALLTLLCRATLSTIGPLCC